jgi:hypothetical protein
MSPQGTGRPIAVAPTTPISRADELFVALDGQSLEVCDGFWELRVMGIHEDRNRYWAQLNIEGPRSYDATFCIDGSSPEPLLECVKEWLARREDAAALSL